MLPCYVRYPKSRRFPQSPQLRCHPCSRFGLTPSFLPFSGRGIQRILFPDVKFLPASLLDSHLRGNDDGVGANNLEEKPRSKIDLKFIQDTNSVNIGLMVAMAAPIGALAMGVILGIGFFGVVLRNSRA